MNLHLSKVLAQGACSSSPACPTVGQKMVFSFGSPLDWIETTGAMCNGEQITCFSNPYSISLTSTTYFGPKFNIRSDGIRIGQLTLGDYDYSYGHANRFNFIGDDFLSMDNPTNTTIPKLTGFHNFDNNISTVFGTYKDHNNTADLVNPVIFWENNSEEDSRLRFISRNKLTGSSLTSELGTILENGNWGIGNVEPNSKLEVGGGLYVTDLSKTTITAPPGFIYSNGPIILGDEAFISSVPSNVFIATYPGTRTALGIEDPFAFLHVHSPTSGSYAGLDDFKLTDQTTGATASDGFSINIDGSNVTETNFENGSLRFGTNGTIKLRIESNGDVVPQVDNSFNLGSSSLRFKEIFCTNSTINTSDIHKKTNIEFLTYGLKEVLKLKPISYNWIENDNGKRLGFNAIEVQKIIPEIIVSEVDSNGIERYGMRYSELIPVLVNATKEQNSRIDQLKIDIENLTALLESNFINKDQKNSRVLGNLYQNEPNPFDDETNIKYYVSDHVKNSYILISEIYSGNEVVKIPINQTGLGSIKVNKGFLKTGIYYYSLQTNEMVIDSKKMIIK